MSEEKKKKFDFKKKKENTVKSLKEVECFLNNYVRYSQFADVICFFKKGKK